MDQARGEQEGGGGVGGNKGNSNMDDAKEKSATRSFVSFPPEKETEEPWPPPLLHISRRCHGESGTAISVVHFSPNAYLIFSKTIAKLTVLPSNS